MGEDRAMTGCPLRTPLLAELCRLPSRERTRQACLKEQAVDEREQIASASTYRCSLPVPKRIRIVGRRLIVVAGWLASVVIAIASWAAPVVGIVHWLAILSAVLNSPTG